MRQRIHQVLQLYSSEPTETSSTRVLKTMASCSPKKHSNQIIWFVDTGNTNVCCVTIHRTTTSIPAAILPSLFTHTF
jgi:hypothetical protein